MARGDNTITAQATTQLRLLGGAPNSARHVSDEMQQQYNVEYVSTQAALQHWPSEGGTGSDIDSRQAAQYQTRYAPLSASVQQRHAYITPNSP